MASVSIEIVRVTPTDLTPDLLAQTEAIFFEASGRTFEPGGERDAFRERWFGRYLSGGSDALFLALAPGGRVAGYLVGAVEEPGPQPRFADISYFRTDFAELCRRFPAHLHINLAPEFRSRGIGPRLIDAFGAHAASHGAPGMHAVTGKGLRNVGFYARCGLTERGGALWNGREIVFLARELTAGD
jgi:GNAT superfamily N-acetyltransferase